MYIRMEDNIRTFGRAFETILVLASFGSNPSFPILSPDGAQTLHFPMCWSELMSAKSADDLTDQAQERIEEFELYDEFEIETDEILELDPFPVRALFAKDWETFEDALQLRIERRKRPEKALRQFNILARMKLQALAGERYWGTDRVAAGSLRSKDSLFVHQECRLLRSSALIEGIISPEEYFTMKERHIAPIPLKSKFRSPDTWIESQSQCIRYQGVNRIQGRIGPKHSEIGRHGGPWGLGIFRLRDKTAGQCERQRLLAYESGAITAEELESLRDVDSYPITEIPLTSINMRRKPDQWLRTWAPCGKVPRD